MKFICFEIEKVVVSRYIEAEHKDFPPQCQGLYLHVFLNLILVISCLILLCQGCSNAGPLRLEHAELRNSLLTV